jgi:site-specific DNA-methyltransferase (adenine-specific)
MTYKIHTGDNRQILKTLSDNSIDAIVTDPPYGIDFLGKSWDADTGALETYQECLRVLKPGGHILAFSAARTYHHLAITLEQAGFEIRDQIMWIYSSGFPKSQDIGKSIQRGLGVKETKPLTSTGPANGINRMTFNQSEPAKYAETKDKEDIVVTDPRAKPWAGWGTQLKPAHEPIALARKPLKQSIAANCQEWGTGAINIDATRIPYEDALDLKTYVNNIAGPLERSTAKEGDGINMFEGQVGYKVQKGKILRPGELGDGTEITANEQGRFPSNVLGEITEEYQKYFYCPKVSKLERQEYNNHPTVKPIELMKYLIKLITPPGGVVLDPFNGSGTTGMAAVELGFDYIGCELDPKYVEISIKRIEAWRNRDYDADVFDSLFIFGD